MHIAKLTDTTNFRGIPFQKTQAAISNKVAKTFANAGEIGEGASIAVDFLGKALVVPAVILTTSKESKEKKEYSAFKNPVAAAIQLGMEAPILAGTSCVVSHYADKGAFDVEGSDFSYNVKARREEFVDCFNRVLKDGEKPHDALPASILDELQTKGYSKKLAENFDDFAKTLDNKAHEQITNSFKNFEKTYKNQFHLKNRISAACAILMLPVLCAVENKLHPFIMEKIYKNKDKKANDKKMFVDKFIELNEYVTVTKNSPKVSVTRFKGVNSNEGRSYLSLSGARGEK